MEALHHFFSAFWAAVLAALVWLGLLSSPKPPTFQGYVEGEFVLVSPTLGGTLETRSVDRGMHVKKGDKLFSLDRADELAARDQAAALLKQARDRLANLQQGKRRPEIEVIAAQKAQAEAQMRLAELQLARQKRLIGTSAFSQEQLDQAQAAYDGQRAHVDELTAQIAVARIPQGREDELRAAEADVAANEAALAQAQWRLDQKTVAAPVSGLVADTYFNPGEMVAAGQPVVSILPPENIKVRFFVPQAMLVRVPIGTPIAIRCDGCARPIPATVRFVSPQAEYTPPVLYNRENRERLVFMIEAWPTARPEALRPGQPVDAVLASP
jgi:HlyD family secretion protein